ncbi:VPLPA-CTERM sorting domain-containing protein [Pseudooceanicola onchidii]|uniref:VPLPA-CTERM sorting domain-containing protein n=1 Tax=Pseudooceanicola onchidii TaxID=2562279 RepID=UPI0010AA66DF|nr:VPLPA-CTERM sorting domain-containing protein [Pseudooceanicola onchidii]
MKHILATTALSLLTATAATAGTLGYGLTISGSSSVGANFNVPKLSLSNTGDTGEITAFSITVGDTDYNFDYFSGALTPPAGGTVSITLGDQTNGGVRYDEVALAFTDFGPGEMSSFFLDIDSDSANTVESFREVLFDNGPALNSVVSVSFSTGDILSMVLPDSQTQLTTYSFGQSKIVDAAVPLPASIPLLLAGLGALGVVRSRRRS